MQSYSINGKKVEPVISRPSSITDGGYRGLDIILSALSSRRARSVCYYLMADDVDVINELFLAREVAAWETGTNPSMVPTEKVMQVLKEMQKETFPQLDKAGLIAYDSAVGTVGFGDPPDEVMQLLHACKSIERPN